MQSIPINPEAVKAISDGYLSLGIVGAAMFIVLIITILSLIIFSMQMKSVFKNIADRLENVGENLKAFTEALTKNTIKNEHDQAETLRLLNQVILIGNDTLKKVVRIDDRTRDS